MRFLAAAVLCGSSLLAQPITFHIPPNTGLTVIPANDPGYEAAVQPFFLNPRSRLGNFGGVQRSNSLIVQDTTQQDIRIVVVQWKQTIGRETRSDVTPFRFVKNLITSTFHPGQTVLLFPRAAVLGNNLAVAPSGKADWSNYTRASRIDVFLDSVVFADGSIIGPDTLGVRTLLQAQRQAAADVYNEVQRNVREGKNSIEMVTRLRATRPSLTYDIPQGLNDYAYWYEKMRHSIAGYLTPHGMDSQVHLQLLKEIQEKL